MNAVEHPCYRCQAEIPENTSFCPHCGAPQIRVIAPEGQESPSPGNSESLTSGSTSPAQAQPAYWPQAAVPYSPSPGMVQWELAWKGALLCGVGAAVLCAIPLVSIGFLLWLLGAGAVSVSLYRKQVPTAVTPGMGMKIGALAGVFGFLVNAVFTVASFVALRSSGTFRQALEEQMHKQLAGNPDPKIQEMMQKMVAWISTAQGAATLIAIFLVVIGAIFLLLTAAGGALGASFSGQKRQFR